MKRSEEMGRPCTKCPPTTVHSCCGNTNLRVASMLIGLFKVLLGVSTIIMIASVIAGSSGETEAEKDLQKQSMGSKVLVLAISVGMLFLTAILLAGIFKKRRNYVMIYWWTNSVLLILLVIGLFSAPHGVGQFVSVLVYILFDIYFQIVIRSYYLQLTGAVADPEVPPNATNGPRISRY